MLISLLSSQKQAHFRSLIFKFLLLIDLDIWYEDVNFYFISKHSYTILTIQAEI